MHGKLKTVDLKKTHINRLQTAILALTFPVMATAQIVFEPGTFIDNSGKEIPCEIRNVGWKDNPNTFEYKTPDGQQHTAGLTDAAAFTVGAFTYVRFTVAIDRSLTDLSRLEVNSQPQFRTETLFLRLLNRGKANLYQFEQGNTLRYFISLAPHGKAEQLVYKEYLDPNHGSLIRENNHFRQQLFTVFKEAGIGEAQFKKLRYRQDDLGAVFDIYNGATPAQKTTKRIAGQGFNLKLLAGLHWAKLDVSSVNERSLVKMDGPNLGSGGLEVENILPFNQRKWSLFAAVTYQQYKQSGRTKYNVSATVAQQTLELPFGARHFFFITPKQKIALEAGYVFAVSLNGELAYGNGGPYDARYGLDNAGAVFLGTGYTYDRYSLQLRYTFAREILASYINWSGRQTVISAYAAVRIL